jgi:maleylpyruvate isomerase
MYSSAQQRMADILSGAALPVIDQRTLFAETAFELSQAMEDLTAQQWAHAVRTVQGRTVLAEQVPWLRSREVLIHVVDLQAGVSWNDLPHDFLNALVEDIAAKRSLDGGPRLVLQSPNGERLVEVAGPGQSTVIEGATPDIAAYLAGREHGDLTIVGGGILPSLLPWI